MLGYAFAALVSVSLAVLIEWSVRSEEGWVPEPPARPLSLHELSLYHGGAGSRGLYLAILGQVFDVHKGYKHYGPGGAYHFMAGVDFTSLCCNSHVYYTDCMIIHLLLCE